MTDQNVSALPASEAAGEAAMRDWAELLVARARTEGVELTGEGGLLAGLVRQVLQTGLEVEMADHLGYERHAVGGRGSGNSRNATTPKTVATEIGQVNLAVPRDRAGTFTMPGRWPRPSSTTTNNRWRSSASVGRLSASATRSLAQPQPWWRSPEGSQPCSGPAPIPEGRPVGDQVRVAVVQFATGTDLGENLATCLRMLDAGADEGADLVVMPEFCNHISLYEDGAHCRAVAEPLDGPWIGALARRTAQHGIYTALAVTVPRADDRVTLTSVLLDPDGKVAVAADKQMLMGNERAHLGAGSGVSPVADTAFGPVGLYSCMDGVTFEVPRTFGVRGTRLLLNSLNSQVSGGSVPGGRSRQTRQGSNQPQRRPRAAGAHRRPPRDRIAIKGALRDQAGTSGSDFCDWLSLAWFSSGGKQDAEAVVVEVAEASR